MAMLTFVAAMVVWGILPGLLLLRVARTEWSRVEHVAAAPGLSLAFIAASAYTAEFVGLPVRPLPVALVALALCAVCWALARRFGSTPVADEPEWPMPPPAWLSWAPWVLLLLPVAIVMQLQAVSTELLLPAPMHDGLDHGRWFRLILDLGSLSPAVIAAPPFGPDGAPLPYPWGMHGWLALVASMTSLDPMVLMLHALVLMSAMVPLSIYVLASHLTGRGWVAMAAAALSLYLWWMPYRIWGWGGFPLLAGLVAALPVTRLALTAVDARSAAAGAAAAVGLAGLVFLHPSQLFVALVVASVIAVTLAADKRRPWANAAPFVTALAAAVVSLSIGRAVWLPLSEFMARAAREGAALSSDARYRTPFGPWFDSMTPLQDDVRLWFSVLSVLGAGTALFYARARPFLALHLTIGALVLAARYQTGFTALWYHMPERIWYAQAAALPGLAAAGAAGAILLVSGVAARWRDLSRWQWLAWPVLALVLFNDVQDHFGPWAKIRLFRTAHRNPNLAITDKRMLADFAWMRENIPEGEVIFNAPADWGVTLPFTGHRTVYWSGGVAVDPSAPWGQVLNDLSSEHLNPEEAAEELSRRGIHYVYAGRLSPALQRRGRRALDGEALKAAKPFELVYESPTALIFKVRGSP